MNDTLEQIEQRLHGADELHDIFAAMRNMAAVRWQEASAALPATRAYADTVGSALAEVLALLEPRPARQPVAPLVVLFTPDHGFVGTLLERLLLAARSLPAVAVLVVGERGAELAAQHGLTLRARLALGSHVGAAPALARQLTAELLRLVTASGADGVDVLHPRHEAAGEPALVQRRLLPVDPAALPPVACEPLLNMPAGPLADRLRDEWLLGELAHAAVETLASENAARLRAMDAARHNVEERLDALRAAYRAARQDGITAEIAEMVGAVLAQGDAVDTGSGSAP